MTVRTVARTIRYKSRLLHEIKLAEADDALINRRQATEWICGCAALRNGLAAGWLAGGCSGLAKLT
jgi:hypothetical protein